MNKPYIFAHRGSSGYCIENTMNSFEKAIEMNVGIESDIQLTKDKVLICFHDPAFQIKDDWYIIRKLTLEQLRSLNFEDNREIPTLQEVFSAFEYCSKELRYSFDIFNKETGLKLIKLVNKYQIFDQVEITDRRIYVLNALRKNYEYAKLVYTVPPNIIDITNQNIKFEKLINLNIKVLNVKIDNMQIQYFEEIIKHGFKCYVWGVNSQAQMSKALNLRSNGEYVRAIYTNYPDILKSKRDKIFA